jgi:ABC-2 type transport system permease protein
VPLACVSYYPALGIVGRADPGGAPALVSWLAPLAGFAFLMLSFGIWRIGVRHYRSTGS